MSISGIQGQPLEVTVVSCSKLKDTEWISRQDPYVCVEYGSTKFRTRTCTDGGKNPVFQEKFVFPLIEGLREINVVVWNSNTLTFDDFIGSGKIQLHKVLSQGFDDSAWPLQTKSGRYSGEVKVILHYVIANQRKSGSSHAPSAPPYGSTPTPPYPSYSNPSATSYPPPSTSSYPPHSYPNPYHTNGSYPPVASTASYPPPPTAYSPYPSHSSPYPQPSYPPSSTYPPSTYPPPSSYPPASAYPPPSYPPPAGYPPGIYPPPPY